MRDLLLRQGARAEGQDTALVHPLQQVQSLAGEAPPTISPDQGLCPLRLSFVTVLKSCQREPAGGQACAVSTINRLGVGQPASYNSTSVSGHLLSNCAHLEIVQHLQYRAAEAIAQTENGVAVRTPETVRQPKKKKKKDFTSFGQPTRLITCVKHGNGVICS